MNKFKFYKLNKKNFKKKLKKIKIQKFKFKVRFNQLMKIIQNSNLKMK